MRSFQPSSSVRPMPPYMKICLLASLTFALVRGHQDARSPHGDYFVTRGAASQCGNWQEAYTALHRDVLKGVLPGRYAVNVLGGTHSGDYAPCTMPASSCHSSSMHSRIVALYLNTHCITLPLSSQAQQCEHRIECHSDHMQPLLGSAIG